MEIFLVVLGGLAAVGIIVMALVALSHLESPEVQEKRAKQEILKEMLAYAKTEAEREQIMRTVEKIEPDVPIEDDFDEDDDSDEDAADFTRVFESDAFEQGLFAALKNLPQNKTDSEDNSEEYTINMPFDYKEAVAEPAKSEQFEELFENTLDLTAALMAEGYTPAADGETDTDEDDEDDEDDTI